MRTHACSLAFVCDMGCWHGSNTGSQDESARGALQGRTATAGPIHEVAKLEMHWAAGTTQQQGCWGQFCAGNADVGVMMLGKPSHLHSCVRALCLLCTACWNKCVYL